MSANFIDIADHDSKDLKKVLLLAHQMKSRLISPTPLLGKTVAMIFEKSSTRTRISFEVGIKQLGGTPIALNSSDMQLSRGETIADTAKVMSRYVDAVIIRALFHQTILDFSKNADIPVINGLSNLSHPCQIMSDIMTIEENFDSVEELTISWFGDSNNVLKSWIDAALKFKFYLRIASPKGYQPEKNLLKKAINNGAKIELFEDSRKAAVDANVLITDVWVSMGDHEGSRLNDLRDYQVNEDLLKLADTDAIFLHCLPAVRGNEVTKEVIDGPQSKIIDEAENRLHVQKAILCHLFEAPNIINEAFEQ